MDVCFHVNPVLLLYGTLGGLMYLALGVATALLAAECTEADRGFVGACVFFWPLTASLLLLVGLLTLAERFLTWVGGWFCP